MPYVADVLDELNLMTYDFHGAWDAITGVNAPLYDQAEGDPEPGWSVHGCVENWVGENSNNAKGDTQRPKVNIGEWNDRTIDEHEVCYNPSQTLFQ